MSAKVTTKTMPDGVIRTLYKFNGRTICYINEYESHIRVCAGRPSDPACITWTYGKDSRKQAEAMANEFFGNFTSIYSRTTPS